MMSKLCTTLILLVGLVAISVQGSAIKGHHQAQPVQRVEEQARVSSVKSPASQLAERSPKSAPVQSAAPILESSKKVYNDISYRRSVSQPQASEPAQAQAAAPAAKGAAEAPVAEVARPNDELPAQSVRSVVAKSEPEVPVQNSKVDQPASSDRTGLTARKDAGCNDTHWCPQKGAAAASPVESKPVVPDGQQQPAATAASVVAKAQPEPVEKAAAPVAVETKPVVSEAPQAQQAPASLDARQICHPWLGCNPSAVQNPAASDAVESKPVTPDAQQQPAAAAASVVAKVQSEPVEKAAAAPQQAAVQNPAAPVVFKSKPVVSEAPQAQQASAASDAVESKPNVPDAQQQPAAAAASVVTKVQPEPAEKAAAATSPVESSLQAKKDEPSAKEVAHEPIEVPAPDPGLILSEPIDSTTKLLIDLDEHVQKFLPAEDKQEPGQPPKEAVLVSGVDYSPPQAQSSDSQPSGKSSVPLMPYSSNADNEPIVPPLPASLDKVDKAAAAVAPAQVPSAGQSATRQANHNQHQNQQQVITQLLDQLDSLQNRIQDTINQLVARRRYVMSALLRPMGTYVRRVRTNLERLQNRVNQLQAAASSVGGNSQNQRPGGFVDAAAIETIRRRIDDISKRISDIVNRIRFSLTPTSAPLNNNGRK